MNKNKCNIIKIILFYFILSISLFLWAFLSLLLCPFFSFKFRYKFIILYWCRFAILSAKYILGINYKVHGLENIPLKPCIVIAKHQSTWETLFISGLLEPMSQVIKKELLYFPLFGFALKLLKPIAINRKKTKVALLKLLREGAIYLNKGIWLLIFPEGTRMPYGKPGKFSRGGAALSVYTKYPILPIAHNAGKFWPAKGFMKYTGVIKIVIGPVMYSDGEGSHAIKKLNTSVESWVNTVISDIDSNKY